MPVELTPKQEEILKVCEECDYDINVNKLAAKVGRTYNMVQTELSKMRKKGYYVIAKMQQKKEENDLKKRKEKRENIIQNRKDKTIKKFCEIKLKCYEAIKIAKIIKNENLLMLLLKNIMDSDNICYDNISVLIDELLQYEEDKTSGIDFVIEYAGILLERSMERVEEPVYQLLMKHKVKLSKEQCVKVGRLMDIYEEKIKEEQDSKTTKRTQTQYLEL